MSDQFLKRASLCSLHGKSMGYLDQQQGISLCRRELRLSRLHGSVETAQALTNSFSLLICSLVCVLLYRRWEFHAFAHCICNLGGAGDRQLSYSRAIEW